MKVKTHIDVCAYPDGTITVFTEGGEIIGTLTRAQVLKSIERELRACDWLTHKNLTSFIKKLEQIRDKYRDQ